MENVIEWSVEVEEMLELMAVAEAVWSSDARVVELEGVESYAVREP